ncbi:MAG TPA: hypothetical protein VHO25_11300 [Polyangiaceae bacterium]|nr:hypothetical protein [Polyangiaceae bacterium]
MGKKDLQTVPDIIQLRTIRHFDRDKLVVVRRDASGYQSTYERIEDGTYGGVDDGDFEIVGNDGATFWRKRT